MYGWTQFIVAKSASIAAIATGFVLYLAYFFPRLASVVWHARGEVSGHCFVFTVNGLQIGAAVMIALLSCINMLGVRSSGALQTVFTGAKLAVLAVLILAGIALGHGSLAHFRAAVTPTQGGVGSGLALATISALWAYDGWNNLSMVAGEVKDPRRNMPRALILGSLLVLAVYVLVNIAYFYLLTPGEVIGTSTVAAAAAKKFMGSGGAAFVAVGVMISTFATLNGSILSGSRIPYAQARDGLFPRRLATLNRRFRTPTTAIVAQACVAGLFALSGSYEALYTKAIYSEWIFYALVTAGIIVLRRREPQLPRPYRTSGYPLVPILFVALALLLLVNTFAERRSDALWCLALVGSGLPAYGVWKRLQNTR
jgi:APA family basic amino acid/polyamine antiporter